MDADGSGFLVMSSTFTIQASDIVFSTNSGTFYASDIGGNDYSAGYGINISSGGTISVDTSDIASRDYVDDRFFYSVVYNPESGLLKFYNRKGQQIDSVDIG